MSGEKILKTNNDRRKFFRWISFPTFIFFVLIVLSVHVISYILLKTYFHTWEERAHFGESFVITHSLFDGLAFVALLFTILIQQSEVKSQKEDIKRTIIIQKTLVEILGITAQLNAQYALLDSKNRAHDRSIKDNVPTRTLDTEEAGIKKIEQDISGSIEDLKTTLDKVQIPETE
jgi:hypothetical protein